ncbi:transporter substrate-binding domain-containing protein [Rhizobium sp. P32RR-XVIII]|uniref:transporter substrate-binding domain-containing protein n=1 Tax=Rhizobium sp. P32RR-XVIII TaxID=2726738 RepID=UPI001456F7D7|nr:transporter substrate-binding domain-containing protein [Rhizobium sp. P32RR-XVIII]
MFACDRADASNGTLTTSGPLLVGGIQATNVCLGIRKNEPELQAILNKALGEMAADGTLAELSKKWFKVDLSRKVDHIPLPTNPAPSTSPAECGVGFWL